MADPDDTRLLRALRGLMRPLVRVLIARGVTAPTFYRLLKSVYVEVAVDRFALDDAAPTDSRVSLLTGIHRKDVRALRATDDDGWADARAKSAAFATVLSRWRTDGAVPLSRPDFDALVAGVSTDIRPRTILDELLRQEVVEARGDGLHLTPSAIAGPGSEDHKLGFFAANMGDHLAAAAENLLADDPSHLERAVFYTRLTSEAVDALEARARELGQDLLETLDAESRAAQDAGRDDPANTERYRMGLYFYREGTDAP